MNQELNSLVNYFCLYEGGQKNDFTNKIKPAAEKLAHPSLTIHTGKGSMNKAQWLSSVKSFANEGSRVDLMYLKVEPDESIVYKARLTFSDGVVVDAESKATFENGMLLHVEPFEPDKYNKMFDAGLSNDATPLAAGQ